MDYAIHVYPPQLESDSSSRGVVSLENKSFWIVSIMRRRNRRRERCRGDVIDIEEDNFCNSDGTIADSDAGIFSITNDDTVEKKTSLINKRISRTGKNKGESEEEFMLVREAVVRPCMTPSLTRWT